MKTLVFGSLNIDRTYRVEHLVRPGETLSARRMDIFCGGKGFNQAIALARAGAEVSFAGAVGEDGGLLLDALDRNGIDRKNVLILPGSTGHAVIQVDDGGQNSILILAGANGCISRERIEEVLSSFGAGDLLVAQNEISHIADLLSLARGRGMCVAFNPSPCNEKVAACDLNDVDILLINETEGAALSGQTESQAILCALHSRFPRMEIVLTRGGQGSLHTDETGQVTPCGIYPVQAVDTTAAGDTFTGYFLAARLAGKPVREALLRASVAAGIAVSRHGAEPSIPVLQEVENALKAR